MKIPTVFLLGNMLDLCLNKLYQKQCSLASKGDIDSCLVSFQRLKQKILVMWHITTLLVLWQHLGLAPWLGVRQLHHAQPL